MPDHGKLSSQGANIPHQILSQLPNGRGGLSDAVHSMPSQYEGMLSARVQELCEEIRELRRMLAPPSAVILTGAEVAEHFKRLSAP